MTTSPGTPETLLNLDQLRELTDETALRLAVTALAKTQDPTHMAVLQLLAQDTEEGMVAAPGEGIYEERMVPGLVPTFAANLAKEAIRASTPLATEAPSTGSTYPSGGTTEPANCPSQW